MFMERLEGRTLMSAASPTSQLHAHLQQHRSPALAANVVGGYLGVFAPMSSQVTVLIRVDRHDRSGVSGYIDIDHGMSPPSFGATVSKFRAHGELGPGWYFTTPSVGGWRFRCVFSPNIAG